ncbi:MAG: Crp/Fnr family transcriptional regulator [Bdellovibrionales bacterium RIFOXYC1_FULL_54_43]|nr:MAG: Crp/Fnr family transcriptional regulator [Bdellovibrionales bacterium RIFOXYC1_FULL_54_43]OFZ81463.1 MAG: Crp/Fnr family transcriptional regulator [Bdellovibrionales bacterium RIFOXYD1_FULL_55_31]
MKTIEELLGEHQFFQKLSRSDIDLLAGCGRNQIARAGEYLAHEGGSAEAFYVIRTGTLALEMQAPGYANLTVETLGPGQVVGWSWLFPPYRWVFDVRAVEDSRLVAMDGVCLRSKAEADPALGYRLMKVCAEEMNARLRSTRLQVLDIYGAKKKAS